MVIEVLRVGIADHPHRFARVGPAHDGGILFGCQQRILVARDGARLRRRDEAGAHPYPVGPEGQRRHEATAVEDATGSHHRDRLAHGVHDLRHERHRRHLPGMAARLGALGDDEVTAGLHRPPCVLDLAAHVDHENVRFVAEGHHSRRHAEPGDEDAGTLLDEEPNLALEPARHRGQKVDPERPSGESPHLADLLDHAFRAHRRGSEASETAGFGDGRHEGRVGDSAHAGEHDGVLDSKELGKASLHRASVSTELLSGERPTRQLTARLPGWGR